MTQASHAHVFSAAHAHAARPIRRAQQGERGFYFRLRQHRFSLSCFEPQWLKRCQILLRECTRKRPHPRSPCEEEHQTWPAPLFNQKDLTEELWGIWPTDKEAPHSRRERSPCALGVFMLLSLCNSLSSWIERKPAGFPGSSSWLGWRGMQWMQPLGLAAQQRVWRELMLQQWESDYKVLALRCRMNTGCGSKEEAPNTGREGAALLVPATMLEIKLIY